MIQAIHLEVVDFAVGSEQRNEVCDLPLLPILIDVHLRLDSREGPTAT